MSRHGRLSGHAGTFRRVASSPPAQPAQSGVGDRHFDAALSFTEQTAQPSRRDPCTSPRLGSSVATSAMTFCLQRAMPPVYSARPWEMRALRGSCDLVLTGHEPLAGRGPPLEPDCCKQAYPLLPAAPELSRLRQRVGFGLHLMVARRIDLTEWRAHLWNGSGIKWKSRPTRCCRVAHGTSRYPVNAPDTGRGVIRRLWCRSATTETGIRKLFSTTTVFERRSMSLFSRRHRVVFRWTKPSERLFAPPKRAG